jgi:hypothetical protein
MLAAVGSRGSSNPGVGAHLSRVTPSRGSGSAPQTEVRLRLGAVGPFDQGPRDRTTGTSPSSRRNTARGAHAQARCRPGLCGRDRRTSCPRSRAAPASVRGRSNTCAWDAMMEQTLRPVHVPPGTGGHRVSRGRHIHNAVVRCADGRDLRAAGHSCTCRREWKECFRRSARLEAAGCRRPGFRTRCRGARACGRQVRLLDRRRSKPG